MMCVFEVLVVMMLGDGVMFLVFVVDVMEEMDVDVVWSRAFEFWGSASDVSASEAEREFECEVVCVEMVKLVLYVFDVCVCVSVLCVVVDVVDV